MARQAKQSVVSEDVMIEQLQPNVEPAPTGGPFDDLAHQVRNLTQANCVALLVLDSQSGSGYSVVGPVESQWMLAQVLEQVASTLRKQLSPKLQ